MPLEISLFAFCIARGNLEQSGNVGHTESRKTNRRLTRRPQRSVARSRASHQALDASDEMAQAALAGIPFRGVGYIAAAMPVAS